jgi:hypothetical protein
MSVKIFGRIDKRNEEAPAPTPDDINPSDKKKPQDPARGSIEDSISRRGQEEKKGPDCGGKIGSGRKLEKTKETRSCAFLSDA